MSVAVLSPLAYVGYRDVTISYNLVRELPSDRASVVGTAMGAAPFSRPARAGPITVLVRQENGAFDTPDGERNIAQLTRFLYDIDGVESVRSITEPLGDKPGTGSTPITAAGRRKLAARKHPRSQALYPDAGAGIGRKGRAAGCCNSLRAFFARGGQPCRYDQRPAGGNVARVG